MFDPWGKLQIMLQQFLTQNLKQFLKQLLSILVVFRCLVFLRLR